MGEKVIAFFNGVAKAYTFNYPKNENYEFISIKSGFENVGKELKKVINESSKERTKTKQHQQARG